MGYQNVSESFFTVFPPASNEIELAINFIEEELDVLKDLFKQVDEICTEDEYAKMIASLAFNTTKHSKNIAIPKIELENIFTRFSFIVNGLPVSQDEIPDENIFAAYLLIIREIMYHLQFDRLMVNI